MDELQNIKTAIHEIAHATLHDIDKDAPERPDRRTREVQAESVAYASANITDLIRRTILLDISPGGAAEKNLQN